MKEWLPPATSILDIGCGDGGIYVLLARHYGGKITIHLLDGDEQSERAPGQVGYRDGVTQPWSDRHIAVANVQASAPLATVIGYPPIPTLTIHADLIVSLKSWGHHYPVGTYLPLVMRSLRPNGRVIMDIRVRTAGLRDMTMNGFVVVAAISGQDGDHRKCQRYVLELKP